MGENMDEDRQGLPRVIGNKAPPSKKEPVSKSTMTKNRRGKPRKKDEDTSSVELASDSDDDSFENNTSPRHTRSVTQKIESSKWHGKGGNGRKNSSKQKKGRPLGFRCTRALNYFPAALESDKDSKKKTGKC
jgi:hypothetical protein